MIHHHDDHLHFEGGDRSKLGINIAPLIDVVFLLLVFFMLTTSFLEQESIILNLPEKTSAAATDADEPLVIEIADNGALFLDGEPIDMDDLTAALRGQLPHVPGNAVWIRAAREVPVQRTIEVMDRIRAAGSENIKFVSRVPK